MLSSAVFGSTGVSKTGLLGKERGGGGGEARRHTFDQLPAVRLAGRDLEGDYVALGLVQELDGYADCGRHGGGDVCVCRTGGRRGALELLVM